MSGSICSFSVSDGVVFTCFTAFAAVDTLAVTHVLRIHEAVADAGIASHALIRINVYAEESYRIEERIYRAERTDKTAERPETDHAYQDTQYQNEYFP